MPALTRSMLAISLLPILQPTPAFAWSLGDVPIIGPIVKEAEKQAENAGKLIEKGVKEFGNGLRDISHEGEKVLAKTFKEIGNAGEDLRKLAETGKCGGDICTALDATVEYAENNVKDAGKAVEQAGKRLSEGKPIDAFWHLSIAPYDIQQENAAKAAMKSSVLRAVGQVAASAYGGPQGAAAYAAWLTYHQTDGNLDLAIKAGAIAGATAYAMSAISNDVNVADVTKNIQIDEIFQRAAMTGAVSGAAVALSGGSQTEVEQAFTKGAVTSVIRDGYKELTKADLENNMKASTGEAYCKGARHDSGLSCLPEPEAYVRDEDGNVVYEGKEPKVDMTMLKQQRPHVGRWSAVEDEAAIGGSERSGFMTGVSRVPGMNGMAVAHDIFDEKFNPEVNAVVDMAFRTGTIAPFVVMTYEGAGFGVQEMIRDVTKRKLDEAKAAQAAAAGPVTPPVLGAAAEPAAQPTANQGATPVDDANPVEIRHLYCKREGSPPKNMLMEINLAGNDPDMDYERICRIDRYLGEEKWRNIWHAHFQTSFCIDRYNEMAIRYVNDGFVCYTSLGVRFDPKVADPVAAPVAAADGPALVE